MVDEYRHRNGPRIVMGLVVIAIGVLFTLDKLGYVRAGDFWEYWPVILIAVGLGRIIQPGMQGRAFGVFMLVLGTWFLLSNLDVIHYHPFDFWPVLLVLLGATMVWRAVAGPSWEGCRPRLSEAATEGAGAGRAAVAGLGETAAGEGSAAAAGPAGGSADTSATVSATSVLGGVKRKCVSQDFRGGDLTAILGGCELDLRQASISGGRAVLDTFALWGGVEIRVPLDWSVVVEGAPILGAFEDSTRQVGGSATKVLVIRGVAIMGGVEVKN